MPASPASPLRGEAGLPRLHVVYSSHLDYGWIAHPHQLLSVASRILAGVFELAEGDPQACYIWEDAFFLEAALKAFPERAASVRELAGRGQLQICPWYVGLMPNRSPGEAIARNLLLGYQTGERIGAPLAHVVLSADPPAMTPQWPQLLAQADVALLVVGKAQTPETPFYHWEAPDGSSVDVAYLPGAYVGVYRQLRRPTQGEIGRDEERAAALRTAVDRLRGGRDASLVLLCEDFAVPGTHLLDDAARLRASFAELDVRLSTPDDFRRDARAADGVARRRGEYPSGWFYFDASLAHIWPLDLDATAHLLDLETLDVLGTLLGLDLVPRETVRQLWPVLIASMDHYQDGQGGAPGDQQKLRSRRGPNDVAEELIGVAAQTIASRVALPRTEGPGIVVFNLTGTPRTEPVSAQVSFLGLAEFREVAHYKEGLRLQDHRGQNVPFQIEVEDYNYSWTVTLQFIAEAVPPLGYRSYSLVPAAGWEREPACRVTLDRDADAVDPRRYPQTDVIAGPAFSLVVDAATGHWQITATGSDEPRVYGWLEAVEERRGNYTSLDRRTGRHFPYQYHGLRVLENGPVRAVAELSGALADVPVRQQIALYASLQLVTVEDEVEWPGDRNLRVHQVIAPVGEPQWRYGTPFGSATLADKLTSGVATVGAAAAHDPSSEELREPHEWLVAGGLPFPFVIASDVRLVGIDGARLNWYPVRGTGRTTAWRITHGDKRNLTYPPPGRYRSRYHLWFDEASTDAPWTRGDTIRRPLLPMGVIHGDSAADLPPTRGFAPVLPSNVILSALKPAEDGQGVVLRVYEVAGRGAEMALPDWSAASRRSDVLERDHGPLETERLMLRPHEIATLRLGVRAGR